MKTEPTAGAKFTAWIERRGVWPRLNFEEIYQAGYEAATAERDKTIADSHHEAAHLARCIWEQNFKADAPDWRLLDTTTGVISQISNMVAGIVQRARDDMAGKDKTIAELREAERQIRITVQAGDRPLADEVSDRIHKMFALQMEVADLTRKLEAEIKERQEYAGRLQGVINERDDALAKLEEMERAHVNPWDSVKRERDAAKREGAEDKARLDWLEEGFNRISCTLSNRHGVTRNALTWVETTPESLQSFREAIDAARRGE